jgi:glycerol kinase
MPIYNAIVWQDRRTADVAERFKEEKGERIKEICGLLPDAYHSATKLMWMLDNVDGARERAERGGRAERCREGRRKESFGLNGV